MDYRVRKHIVVTHGFALPTILIASVVMIIVMLAAIQSVVSIGLALDNQYYGKLAQESGEAGTAFAKACFSLNAGLPDPVWTANQSRVLAPNTTCDGTVIVGASPYVLSTTGIRTTFTVPYPTLDSSGVVANIAASGKVELLRASNGLPWHSQTQSYVANIAQPFIEDSFPLATSIEGYWASPPAGYLLENGAAVSRTLYANLFAAIGTTYGAGDGSTTFNLPDSRGRVTVTKNSADVEFDVMGEKYGEKAHTLTIPEMPSHSHAQVVNANSGGTTATQRDYDADGTGLMIYDQGITTAPTGGGLPHNEIQPSIVRLSAIKYVTPIGPSIIPPGTSIQGYWKDATAISTYAPGYLAEDGSSRATATYPALFSAIGYTYGGAGASFNLPNSRGRVGVNKNSVDVEFDTMGEFFGGKTRTLAIWELPVHTHEMYMKFPNAGGSGIRNDWNISFNYSLPYDQGVNTAPTGGGGAHNNIQPSIVKESLIKSTAVATTEDIIVVQPGTSISGYWPNEASVPSGYLVENGQEVSRTTYASLFAVIGTTHGAGNGFTTFNIPDSRGRVGVNKSSTDTEFDSIGEKYGEKVHTLTINEMPSHAHQQYVTVNSGSTGIRRDWSSDSAGLITGTGQQSGAAGSGLPHDNLQPSIVKLYAIKY